MKNTSKRIQHRRCVQLNVRAITGFEIDETGDAVLQILGLHDQQVAGADALGPLDDAAVVLLGEQQLDPGAGFTEGGDERQHALHTWGGLLHYLDKALSQLPPFKGVAYRALRLTGGTAALEQTYSFCKPVQWGAYVSCSTDIGAVQALCSAGSDVILKVSVRDGRAVGPYAFFQHDGEVGAHRRFESLLSSATRPSAIPGHLPPRQLSVSAVYG